MQFFFLEIAVASLQHVLHRFQRARQGIHNYANIRGELHTSKYAVGHFVQYYKSIISYILIYIFFKFRLHFKLLPRICSDRIKNISSKSRISYVNDTLTMKLRFKIL